MPISLYTLKDISASQERLCHLLRKHSHPEIEISFKFIPKILMSKECIHFFEPLCICVFQSHSSTDIKDTDIQNFFDILTYWRQIALYFYASFMSRMFRSHLFPIYFWDCLKTFWTLLVHCRNVSCSIYRGIAFSTVSYLKIVWTGIKRGVCTQCRHEITECGCC